MQTHSVPKRRLQTYGFTHALSTPNLPSANLPFTTALPTSPMASANLPLTTALPTSPRASANLPLKLNFSPRRRGAGRSPTLSIGKDTLQQATIHEGTRLRSLRPLQLEETSLVKSPANRRLWSVHNLSWLVPWLLLVLSSAGAFQTAAANRRARKRVSLPSVTQHSNSAAEETHTENEAEEQYLPGRRRALHTRCASAAPFPLEAELSIGTSDASAAPSTVEAELSIGTSGAFILRFLADCSSAEPSSARILTQRPPRASTASTATFKSKTSFYPGRGAPTHTHAGTDTLTPTGKGANTLRIRRPRVYFQ